MSTIGTAVKILLELEEHFSDGSNKGKVNKVISLLTDPTVLLIEWNEIDIQEAARRKLAAMDDVEVEKIIDNPLTTTEVADVIRMLSDRYDANYGIDYKTINSVLDNIALPDAESCRKKSDLELQIEEAEKYLIDLISETDVAIDLNRLGKIKETIRILKENQKEN